jgi:AcrR family transcriptional regulator
MATPEPTPLRRTRERELVAATRALFDERGMQHAPIEEIARSAGIARGLVYRHFSSKEELFVLTVTDYLAELDDDLRDAVTASGPAEQLAECTRAYARFCVRYPAFLDCALSLMHRPAGELRDLVSGSVWLRLGQGMATCVEHLTTILRAGARAGDFAVDDAEYTANVLWAQGLGLMHLPRIGVGVRLAAAGIPDLFGVAPERVVETCVEQALAAVSRAPGRPPSAPRRPRRRPSAS